MYPNLLMVVCLCLMFVCVAFIAWVAGNDIYWRRTIQVLRFVKNDWKLIVFRPVCEVHGRWDLDDVDDGFCGKCLDEHLAGGK